MPFILMTWIFVLGVIVTEENIYKSLVVFKGLIQVGLYVKRLRERRGGMNSVFIICIFNEKRNTDLAPFTAATVIISENIIINKFSFAGKWKRSETKKLMFKTSP